MYRLVASDVRVMKCWRMGSFYPSCALTQTQEPFLRRLYDIRSALEQSDFFRKHEVM